jgi:hypothetical protein
MLPRNVRKAAGDIRPAGEDNAFDLRADRRQRATDIVAAIEEGGEPGLRNRLACRRDERPEPTWTYVTASIRGTGEYNRTPDRGRGGQRGDSVGKRVNDDDTGAAVDYGGCSSNRLTRSSNARKRSTTRAFWTTMAVTCSRILIRVSS